MKRIHKIIFWLLLLTLGSCSASPTYPSPIYQGHYEGKGYVFDSEYQGSVQIVQEDNDIHAMFTIYGLLVKAPCWRMEAGNLTCRYDEKGSYVLLDGTYTKNYWTGVIAAKAGHHNGTGTFWMERVEP
jgi:hypothetical protein